MNIPDQIERIDRAIAETQRLQRETQKFVAETHKLTADAALTPWTMMMGFFTAGAATLAAGAALMRLLD